MQCATGCAEPPFFFLKRKRVCLQRLSSYVRATFYYLNITEYERGVGFLGKHVDNCFEAVDAGARKNDESDVSRIFMKGIVEKEK